MTSVYENWILRNKTVRIESRKYTHSCPLPDFIVVLSAIIALNNAGIVIKTSYIADYLVANRFYTPKALRANKYKIAVVLNVLLLEGLVEKRPNHCYQIIDAGKLTVFFQHLKRVSGEPATI